MSDKIPVFNVSLWLCGPCLDGEGDECHVPGCSLWMHRPPSPSIRASQGVVIYDEHTDRQYG